MKKKILALVLVASNFAMFAQQWTGSTTNTGTITHLGPINVDLSTQIGTGANKITFNPGWNMSNALGCIGFNF